MKSPSKETLDAHSQRYPTSIFLDLQLCVLAVLFGALTLFTYPTLAWAMLLVGSGLILVYHLFDSVVVLRMSQRVQVKNLDPKIHARCSEAYNWQVRGVFFRPVILFPRNDEDTSKLIHELGHVRSGDHRLFLFIKPVMLLMFFCYMSIFGYGFATINWHGILFGEDMPPVFFIYSFFFVVLTIPVASLFLVGAVFLAKREREYLADLFADGLGTARYRAHMDHEDLCEQAEFDTSLRVKLWNWFACPSYAERSEHLNSERFVPLKLGFLSGALVTTPLVLLKFLERAGQNRLGDVSGRIFDTAQSEYAFVLALNFALISVLVFGILYTASLVTFTVSRDGTTETLTRLLKFSLGMLVPKVVTAYPDLEIYSDDFWSIWFNKSLDSWVSDLVAVYLIVLICLLVKRFRGFWKAHSLPDIFAISAIALLAHWWLGV